MILEGLNGLVEHSSVMTRLESRNDFYRLEEEQCHDRHFFITDNNNDDHHNNYLSTHVEADHYYPTLQQHSPLTRRNTLSIDSDRYRQLNFLPESSGRSFDLEENETRVQKQPKKRVRFATDLVTLQVGPEDHNVVDVDTRWYSAEEFRASTMSLQTIIAKARQKNPSDDSNDSEETESMRGLEDVVCRDALMARQRRYRSMKQMILLEQSKHARRQEMNVVVQDPEERLAETSRQISHVSTRIALQRAKEDAKAACC